MLEMPRKSGGKVMSHLLSAHGSDIFIHTLATSRSVLEDLASIEEGYGGRIKDYRETDFGEFMKQNILVPLRGNASARGSENYLLKMRTRLDRQTKYWPLTISSMLICNLKSDLEPLPTLIMKKELTDEEVNKCKEFIYKLICLESKHEPLPLSNSGQRGKMPNSIEEQYKVLWEELDKMLTAENSTDQHKHILNCLHESRMKVDEKSKKDDKIELDEALRELDHRMKNHRT